MKLFQILYGELDERCVTVIRMDVLAKPKTLMLSLNRCLIHHFSDCD